MVTSIIEKIEAKAAGGNIPRQHLGLSECGHPCSRYLWYAHHATPAVKIDGRVIRLFRLGDMVETAIISDLRGIGIDVTDQQKEVTIKHNGVTLRGHIDGIVDKTTLLEIKSANEKSFRQLQKLGYEKWQPKYKAQAHIYMALIGLRQCLCIVENKNDSGLYAEILMLDDDYVTKLLMDVFTAITADEPPQRMCPDASWYEAKYCKYKETCFT